MPKHIATWNPARGVWETGRTSLLCEHSELFSETWPSSGMTRSGVAYELPTWEPLTDGSGSSLLPTLRATRGGSNTETVRLLPTPNAVDGEGGRYNSTGHQDTLPGTVRELSSQPPPGMTGHCTNLDVLASGQETDWGIYAAAIAWWELLTRPAPPPTQPSKKGTPQLSARFSEWLMGLPDGWVTDVPGITRNEALKALGNGVVPQQAEAALRFLLTHLEASAA